MSNSDNDFDEFNIELDDDLKKLLDGENNSDRSLKLRNAEQHEGFDNNTGTTWIYPSNLPLRQYQMNIVKQALYRNTLVVLPTGLGKTFIAAVVMYNLYRWYPKGKVIFMAPTRPLVTQQIEACQHIMPFPSSETVELTGKLSKTKRAELWRTKRVFFATPQSVQSDILGTTNEEDADEPNECSEIFPFKDVKLLVVDEAHKARGRYAYVEVTQALFQKNKYFRMLALSATPGRSVDDIAEVCSNLLISHLEVRWDTSIDVMPYVHKRNMKTVVVPLGDKIKALRERLMEIVDPYLRQLIDSEVLRGSIANINRNFLLFEQKRFKERSLQQRHNQHSMVISNFSFCISFFHAFELLERHGIRVFLNYFEEDEEGRNKFLLNIDRNLRDLVYELRAEVGPNPFDVSTSAMTNGMIPPMPKNLDFGHPKFEEARKVMLEHFEKFPESRAICFCEYRESVMLIHRLLLQHAPLLKPRCFVGQGGTGSLRALSQKQQIQIMNDFRKGLSNILIATCIGEEGIDVGEVELIVCFDISTSNPTRFVQRIGRTGRKKNGNVVMLVTEGKEQQILKDVLAHKNEVNKKLLQSSVVKNALYQHAPRLVPTEFNPQVVHTFVKPPDNDNKPSISNKNKKSKGNAKNSGQDLRNFFKKSAQTTAINLDEEEQEIFDVMHNPTQMMAMGAETQQQTEKSLSKIKTFFQDLNVSSIVAGSNTQLLQTQAKNKEIDKERIKKLNILYRKTPLVPAKDRMDDLTQQLLSSKISKEVKLIILRSDPDFVKDINEKMKVLQALEIDPSHMSTEENSIRQLYEQFLDLFNGMQGLTDFLEEIEYNNYKNKCKLNSFESDNDSSDDTEADYKFQQILKKIFPKTTTKEAFKENSDFIEELYKQTAYYQNFNASSDKSTLNMESMIYNSMALHENDKDDAVFNESQNYSDFVESKYASQVKKITAKSTPLMKAFQKQHLKKQNSNENTNKIYEQSNETAEESNSTPEKPKLPSKDSIPDAVDLHSKLEKFSQNYFAANDFLEISSNAGFKSLAELNETAHALSPAFNKFQKHRKASLNSTPLNFKQTKNSPVVNSTPIHSNTKSKDSPVSSVISTMIPMADELDLDMELFLEPFPEEQQFVPKDCNKQDGILSSNSEKENLETQLTNFSKSPDIFATSEDSNSPLKKIINNNTPKKSNAKRSLAAKLAARQLTPTKSLKNIVDKNQSPFKSPKHKNIINSTENHQTSPSLFDSYLKNMKSKAKIPKRFHSEIMQSDCKPKVLPVFNNTQDSPIVNKRKTSKRKIFESDSEQKDDDSETDCEEILATEMPSIHHRQKKRRICSFIEDEAGKSGSDHSSDEAEHTIGNYMLDSVIVQSGSSDGDESHVQAMYLQSLKSPQQKPGAFKIPQFRVYNDRSQIYSQAVIPVEDSQYLPDSFIVEEEEEPTVASEVSMCPLEKAERILKERKRAKKLLGKTGKDEKKEGSKTKKKKKIVVLDDSSDEYT